MSTDDAAWDGIEEFREEARALAEELFLRAEKLAGERDAARNRVAALEKNGAELLARAELAEAERNALKAAIADVRRLQELTIAASCRVQAIDQATDTLAVLDRALGVAETPGSES